MVTKEEQAFLDAIYEDNTSDTLMIFLDYLKDREDPRVARMEWWITLRNTTNPDWLAWSGTTFSWDHVEKRINRLKEDHVLASLLLPLELIGRGKTPHIFCAKWRFLGFNNNPITDNESLWGTWDRVGYHLLNRQYKQVAWNLSIHKHQAFGVNAPQIRSVIMHFMELVTSWYIPPLE